MELKIIFERKFIGTVYSYNGEVLFDERTKGLNLTIPEQDGFYVVFGQLNELGEVYEYKLELNPNIHSLKDRQLKKIEKEYTEELLELREILAVFVGIKKKLGLNLDDWISDFNITITNELKINEYDLYSMLEYLFISEENKEIKKHIYKLITI